jgi:uncharacterized RDD family membrane protein YckC
MKEISQVSNNGVYYQEDNYAGFWIRILAWGIDFVVLSVIVTGIYYCYLNLPEFTQNDFRFYFWLSFLLCYFYLTVIKRTEFSTLGFHTAKIKIVNLQGKTPSFWLMTFRFILLSIGPFSLIIDLLWLTGEKTKQTLRDKFVGTYVVQINAEPMGTGKIVYTMLHFLGWNLSYREVSVSRN